MFPCEGGEGWGGVVDDGEGVGGSCDRVRVREWRYQWMDAFIVTEDHLRPDGHANE